MSYAGKEDARPNSGPVKNKTAVPMPDGRGPKSGPDWRGMKDVRPSSAPKALKSGM